MAKLEAGDVARLLTEFGHRVALAGGDRFRARAFARAAENLLALTKPLAEIIAEDRLREIPGVGAAIAGMIARMHATGTHPALEAMRSEMPAGLLDLLSIPGLRPDRVVKLHQDLGISSLKELEEAARADRIKTAKGLGASLQAKIVQGLEIRKRGQGQRHLHRAAALIEAATANLRESHLRLRRIVAAGEFRRGCELVSELSLVAEAPAVEGDTQIVKISPHLSVHLSGKRHFGTALLLATGSQAHLAGLRELASQQGMRLDQSGLWRGRRIVAGAREADIYAALGLPFIEPELREDGHEIALARKGKLPQLVRDEDIRGILHAHSDASDGGNTLAEMAAACRKRGYGYFGIADHSQSAHYAGGLSVERVRSQHSEVDRLNRRYGERLRVFKGIESDILADGSLDYPADVLEQFDFVVASIHSRFKLDRKSQTERLIRAVANPHTTIIGHMTGRQLLRRPGYEVDVEAVLAACAAHGVAVEINANPWRLDLDWRWHARALELGCMMSINPDAHSIDEIDLTHWGVEMARKGGVPKDRVLNCLALSEFTKYLTRRRVAIRRSVRCVPLRRRRASSLARNSAA
jgi:DNA polymerase (family 10)